MGSADSEGEGYAAKSTVPGACTFTWSKARRLRKRCDFIVVQSSGHRLHTRNFLVVWLPTTRRERVGITVSKRVGSSPVRNRVKRLVRECCRQMSGVRPGFTKNGVGADIVVIAKRGAGKLRAMSDVYNELGRIEL